MNVLIIYLWKILLSPHCILSQKHLPTFGETMQNRTIAVGRDTFFSCVINNLGKYKVAWAHIDRKMVLSVHHDMLTRIPRFIITHENYRTWTLHVKDVKVEDRGEYMCQINTDPMLSQRAFLTVTIPPTIDDTRSTPSTVSVMEFGTITLSCSATGFPEPNIIWRRSNDIFIRINDNLEKFPKTGKSIFIPNVTRSGAGFYFCIANNGVPPPVSKRIQLVVNLCSSIVLVPLFSDVILACSVESHPKPVLLWFFEGNNIQPGRKYEIIKNVENYTTSSELLVRNASFVDLGTYTCLFKNPVGETRGYIELHARKEATSKLYEVQQDKFFRINNKHASLMAYEHNRAVCFRRLSSAEVLLSVILFFASNLDSVYLISY